MMRTPSLELLGRRLLQELAGGEPALLDARCRQLLAAQDGRADAQGEGLAEGDAPGSVLALVCCARVTGSGSAEVSEPEGRRLAERHDTRVVAVLPILGDVGGVLVPELPGEVSGVQVARVITPVVVMDVTPEGLAIVELLEGVSAADVQAMVEPTLLISPRLKQLLGKPDKA
jgi:hypothetical protein